MNILDIQISKEDIVIDCGANVGDITKFFLDKGAYVYAFEPNSHAYNFLFSRFKNNKNVLCIEKGVAAEYTKRAKLFLHEKANLDQIKFSTGSSIIEEKNNINKNNFLEVELVDLCKFINNLNKKIRVLKIDIEGAEIELLKKIINTETYKKVDFIFVETHEKKIPSLMSGLNEIKDLIKVKNINNINLEWV